MKGKIEEVVKILKDELKFQKNSNNAEQDITIDNLSRAINLLEDVLID